MFWRRKWMVAEIRECRDAVLNQLSVMEKRLMSGFDDLKAAVESLKTVVQQETDAVNLEITTVNAVIAQLKQGGLSDADAEALAQSLQGAVTNLSASVTNLNNESQSVQQG